MNDLNLEVDMLDALLTIKTSGAIDIDAGICDNVVNLLEDNGHHYRTIYDLIGSISSNWERFSGNTEYPVPAVTKTTPREEFDKSVGMWSGEYGELRHELLDFLIEELTKKVGV